MASDNKPPGREDIDRSNDDNPFVAFKKYADEQFASFFQNFIGLPSSTQLRNLERSYFDEDGHLKPISDLIGKAVEAKESHLEAKQPADRRVFAMDFRDDPFVSLISEKHSLDAFERWHWQAERQAEKVADLKKVDHCPYRPAETESSTHCPYRPVRSEPKASDRQSPTLFNNAKGLSLWSKNPLSENCYSNHYAMHRSHSGVTFHIQNIPLSAWSLPYIAMSPYSPLAVERELHDGGASPNMQWRNAFKDLILLHKGQPMEDMTYHNNMDDRTEKLRMGRVNTVPGIQWVWNMFNEGLFGNWYPVDSGFTYNTLEKGMCRFQVNDDDGTNLAWEVHEADLDGRMGEERTDRLRSKEDDDEMTELDLYEHFLGNRDRTSSADQGRPAPRPFTKRSSHNVPTETKSQSESSKESAPSIISTLTTTERQVFPDGTVHTKVVLKKRFADGREESNEAEHTTHAGTGPENTRYPNNKITGADSQRLEGSDDRKESKPKKGWFW